MNIINSGVIIETTNELKKKSLPNYFLENTTHIVDDGLSDLRLRSLEDVERDHIKKIVSFTGGNKTKAAQILGISRISLLSKIKKYKLE